MIKATGSLVLIAMALVVSTAMEAEGQGTIRGTVSLDGSPVQGIFVQLVELGRHEVTDPAGRYTFSDVASGTFSLRVAQLGFRRTEVRVAVGDAEDVVVDISLTPEQVSLQEIAAGPGPRSVWVGAHAAYDLGPGNAVDNFQASGRGVLEILGPHNERFGIYLTGSVSRLKTDASVSEEDDVFQVKLRELQRSANGVNAAIVPHLFWGDPYDWSITTWISAGWKLNALNDTSGVTQYFHQGVGSLGVEVTGLRGLYSQMPTSLSIVPSITVFSGKVYESVFGERRSDLQSLTAVLILPAGAGRGLLFDIVATRHVKPAFSVGLLLTSTGNPAPLARP